MKFTLIHASYGRPDLATSTKAKWIRDTHRDIPIEYILSVDKSDPKLDKYEFNHSVDIMTYNSSQNMRSILLENDTNTSVQAINNAASISTGELIIVISDDFDPIPNWDLEILKAVEGKEDWILKTQDGTQDWIITLPIMDRKYYERFGYVYYPEYAHMFCDTEMSGVADMLGKRITSQLLFKHNHYTVKDGIKKDSTSDKADRTWNQGEQLFMERASRNFDIENPLPSPRTLQTLNWCKNRKK